jgi:hypothetical protein
VLNNRLILKLDEKGSETTRYKRYTFGTPGSMINGGVYVDKTVADVDEIVLVMKENSDAER